MPTSHHAWIVEVLFDGDIFAAIQESTLQGAVSGYQRAFSGMPDHKAQIALVCVSESDKRASVTDNGEFVSDTGFVPPVRFQRELKRHASAVLAADI